MKLRIYRTFDWVNERVPVENIRIGGPARKYLASTDTVQVYDEATGEWGNLELVEAPKPQYPSSPKPTSNPFATLADRINLPKINIVPTITSDRNNEDLNKPMNEDGTGQNKAYLVLSAEDRAKGRVRPLRKSYVHDACKGVTTMGYELADTYAVSPGFYGRTFCTRCNDHFSVDQFKWVADGAVVGS